MIHATQARKAGLKVLKTLKAKAQRHSSGDFWVVNVRVLYDNGQEGWRYNRTHPLFGERGVIQYSSEGAADEAAERLVAEATKREARLVAEESEREARQRSERLKQDKARACSKRLHDEVALMREEAKALWADASRPIPEAITVESLVESSWNNDLIRRHYEAQHERAVRVIRSKVIEMPYLRHVWSGDHYSGNLYSSLDGVRWEVKPEFVDRKRAREIANRAEIAEAWGLDPSGHWGKIKAEIRRRLKPRANELLEEASVKRLLDDALARNCKALRYGNIIFWYEQRALRWVIKQIQRRPNAQPGESLWREGKIISKNHGRIIVLPYVKEDGEKINGYTKNAPGDGYARPRHPSDYLEIPFEEYDGDLMIGLKGELHYD